jgi:hypothetical protein
MKCNFSHVTVEKGKFLHRAEVGDQRNCGTCIRSSASSPTARLHYTDREFCAPTARETRNLVQNEMEDSETKY